MKMSEEEFLEFAADVLEVPLDSIGMETSYQSIPQWDSIKHMRLVMECEACFDADISLESVAKMKTLNDFYNACNAERMQK